MKRDGCSVGYVSLNECERHAANGPGLLVAGRLWQIDVIHGGRLLTDRLRTRVSPSVANIVLPHVLYEVDLLEALRSGGTR